MKDTRERVYRFRVNNAESDFIEKKFLLSSCETLSDFFRTMIMYGVVLKYDEQELKKSAQISNIFLIISIRLLSVSIPQTVSMQRTLQLCGRS